MHLSVFQIIFQFPVIFPNGNTSRLIHQEGILTSFVISKPNKSDSATCMCRAHIIRVTFCLHI